jgi:hypothetical protein
MVLLHEKVFPLLRRPRITHLGLEIMEVFLFVLVIRRMLIFRWQLLAGRSFFSLIKKTEASSKLGDRRTLLLG